MNAPRVLLIEDNDQNAYLVRFVLEKDGMVVERARTGAEGLRAVDEHPFDVILLDIQLPVMDGYRVAATLRQHPRFKSLPIIALTSFALPSEKERALGAGFNGYIEKPISPLTLASEVRRALSRP